MSEGLQQHLIERVLGLPMPSTFFAVTFHRTYNKHLNETIDIIYMLRMYIISMMKLKDSIGMAVQKINEKELYG